MTRDEWYALYREARTAVSEQHASDREGCQKECITLDELGAVVKRAKEVQYMGEDQPAYYFLRCDEEPEAYRHLNPDERPWTVFHPKGFQIQQAANMDGWMSPRFESVNAGFTDLHANNWGTLDDDRDVIIDWGVLKTECPLAKRFERNRRIKILVNRERLRRLREGLGQSGRHWVVSTAHALRDRLDEIGADAR